MTTVAAELGTLTPRQREVAEAFLALERETGSPPTIRELCVRLKISSPNGMMCHINALTKKGWMRPPRRGGRKLWTLTADGRTALGGTVETAGGQEPNPQEPWSVIRNHDALVVTVRRQLSREEALGLADAVRSAALAPEGRGR